MTPRELKLWYCTSCGTVSVRDQVWAGKQVRLECSSGSCTGKTVHKPVAVDFYAKQFVTA